MCMRRALFGLIMCCLMLSGCSSFSKQDPALHLAVNIAVMKAIEKEEGPGRDSRARRIIQLCDIANTMLDDKDVALSAVYDRVMREIDWDNLEPSDRLLLMTLISETSQLVVERIENRTLDGDKKTSIKTAVGWVKDAAKTYVQALEDTDSG